MAGAGTIACGLAACAALRLETWCCGRAPPRPPSARGRVATLCEKLERPRPPSAFSDRCRRALAPGDVVVEAVVEDEFVKRQVLGRLHEALEPDALLCTTTSSLSMAELGRASRRPTRFFGLHVFNPVDRMPLVELCFAPRRARTPASGRCTSARRSTRRR